MIRLLGPPARLLARLGALALLIALAIAGAAVAIFCIQGGAAPLSLPSLAQHLGLPGLRDSVLDLLGAVEADGTLAVLSAVGGLGAMALGGLLIVGVVSRPSEREFELDDSPEGRITARARPLADAAARAALELDGVTDSSARARASRSGGQVIVTAVHRGQDPAALEERVEAAVSDLRSSFGLTTRVRMLEGGSGKRVE